MGADHHQLFWEPESIFWSRVQIGLVLKLMSGTGRGSSSVILILRGYVSNILTRNATGIHRGRIGGSLERERDGRRDKREYSWSEINIQV